jgi:broad specificity phosphatase PhoE
VARLILIRHGRAAAGWDDDPDPGLDDLGRSQATAVAAALGPEAARPIVSSPLRRCRETAAPLAARWGGEPIVDAAVAEIPSPEGVPMGERVPWLQGAMGGTWTDLGPRYTSWRDNLIAGLVGIEQDTVIFSHFVAINAAIGSATGNDRLVIHHLDNCSRTVIDTDGVRLLLVRVGHEADTLIR